MRHAVRAMMNIASKIRLINFEKPFNNVLFNEIIDVCYLRQVAKNCPKVGRPDRTFHLTESRLFLTEKEYSV